MKLFKADFLIRNNIVSNATWETKLKACWVGCSYKNAEKDEFPQLVFIDKNDVEVLQMRLLLLDRYKKHQGIFSVD